MELRAYQSEAVASVWNHIEKRDDNPCIVLPTGAGKGVVLAQLAKDVHAWGGRICILAHVRELLAQTAGNIERLAPEVPLGIYSAGLKARDLGYACTVAGIQSVYNKADKLGKLDVIAIDEAHRIPGDGEGMYQTFLKAAREINPAVRLIGLTATPYRTSSGLICQPENLLNHVCFEIGVRKLIRDGWLSPLRSKVAREKYDLTGVAIQAGEYVKSDLEQAMMRDEQKIAMACLEVTEQTQTRKSALVFCSGVEHAKIVASMLAELSPDTPVERIFGDTASTERDRIIKDFREGRIKYLVNVDVLTTGFDAPAVDCVAVLRPTMSPGLWYQMCGRGFRKAEGKENCLILDFGGNALRHGPVDHLTPPRKGRETDKKEFKECPGCQEAVPYGCEVCLVCGFTWEKPEPVKRGVGHGASAYDGDVLGEPSAPEWYDVTSVNYWKHLKKNAPMGKPPTLWVEYTCGLAKFSEWVCFEHVGFAQKKAFQWWIARSAQPFPKSVDLAVASIEAHGISEPKRIKVVADGKYMRIQRAWDFEFKPPVIGLEDIGETGEKELSNDGQSISASREDPGERAVGNGEDVRGIFGDGDTPF